MGLMFGFEVGGWGRTIFEITLGTWILKYVVSNLTIFSGLAFFLKSSKSFCQCEKVVFENINSCIWDKNGSSSCLRKVPILGAWPYSLPLGYIEWHTARPEGPSYTKNVFIIPVYTDTYFWRYNRQTYIINIFLKFSVIIINKSLRK